MSLWKRLFGKDDEATSPNPAPAEPEAPAPPAAALEEETKAKAEERALLGRLRRVGRPGGMDVDDALGLLRHHDGTAKQTPVLHALLEGMTDDRELDPVRVACATLLDERGDRARALRLLEQARSVHGMMLAADLLAQDGNIARALSTVERVLARSIDTPGARERHERWSALIGRGPTAAIIDDSATVVAPTESKTSFRLLRQVARGGAGTVYEAEDELLGRRLAFKVYHRAEEDQPQIEREARTAARLAGPGILRVFDADPARGWLATEWIACGSLRDVLKSGRVEDVLPLHRWLPRLLSALERVHDDGLVHADIKPANVLFRTMDDPVLGDFGVCQASGQPSFGGTPGYMSPERLGGALAEPRDDVYALGRIIEDVLAARDDAASERDDEDARRYARVAVACMADAAERPPDAGAVLGLLAAALPGQQSVGQ